MTPAEQGLALALARQAISAALESGEPPPLPAPAGDDVFSRVGACFVTLTQQGELRGCIGTLTPHRPLGADIVANACAAAFRDPRFAPVSAQEWPETRVSLSVLGPQQPLTRGNRQQLLAQLQPGEDGLVIETAQGQRATFLPSVWAQLPQREDFLDHLKAKAGLPADFDELGLRAWRYDTESFGESAE